MFIVDITQLSKPLLQSEGSLNWSKHVTPGTLSIFHDEKSWSGIHTIEPKKKTNVKEFKDSYGMSWHQMKDAMHLESESKLFLFCIKRRMQNLSIDSY